MFSIVFYNCSSEDEPKKEIEIEIKDPDPVINSDFPLSDQENSGNWVLNAEMSDEFEVSVLDEDKWQIQGKDGFYRSNFIGRAPSQFSVNNVEVIDGKLKIISKWEPDFNFSDKTQTVNGTVYEYENITTAAVSSKQVFQYGYMEIKSKSANSQVTSSFWTTNLKSATIKSELDMFESFGGHKTNAAWRKRLKFNIISWDPNNQGQVYTDNIQADNNTADDFHVYGFEWTDEYIKVYIDGTLHPKGTILKSNLNRWVTDTPYHIWFDSETFPWLGLPTIDDLPAAFEIEYLRVWQKN